jgi:hypothetical protein
VPPLIIASERELQTAADIANLQIAEVETSATPAAEKTT